MSRQNDEHGSWDMDGIEIGVIGAGWWAVQNHIPALLENPHVASIAVNRPDAPNLEKLKSELGLKYTYTDAAAMLAERPLAGVVVSSPHTLHAQHARMCLERGLPVLVEKPMTTNAGEARDLVALARQKNVEIVIPYGWNFKPFSEAARRLVKEGWLGEIRHVVCQMASPTGDLFAGEGLKETEGQLFRPPASTWADPDKAGGYGWGQLSHALGALFLLADLAPARVFARTGLSKAGVDWYDAAVVELENGATVSLSGSSTVPKSRGFQVDIRIFGTEGMLLYDVERERVEAVRHDGKEHVEPISPGDGAYSCTEPIARFAEICRGQSVFNPAPGSVGQHAVEVLDAMYRSAASGSMEEV